MLKQFVDYITYALRNLVPASHTGDTVNFFIYDTLKVKENEIIPPGLCRSDYKV